MKKRAIKFGIVGALVLSTVAMAYGGWCVVTVEDVPESATVGTPLVLEYTVRQHGQSDAKMKGLIGGAVVAVSGTQTVTAKSTEGSDKYVARLTLPSAGEWKVSIKSGFTNGGQLAPIVAVNPGVPAPAPQSAIVRGRSLFLAKGCYTCHENKDLPGTVLTSVGPELVRGKLGVDYVSKLLADPTKATKTAGSSFRMPNLNLKPAEIAALTSYLTAVDH